MIFTSSLISKSLIRNAGIIFTKSTTPKSLYPIRFFGTSLQRSSEVFIPKQKIKSLLPINSSFRQAVTRFCAKAAEPARGQKAVGWWLVGCSGMVFVAVVLGGTIIYGFIMLCVIIVLDKVIRRTIR